MRQEPDADRPRESPTPCTIDVSIAPDFFDGILFDDQKMHDLSGLLDVPALYGLPPVIASVKDHAEEKNCRRDTLQTFVAHVLTQLACPRMWVFC